MIDPQELDKLIDEAVAEAGAFLVESKLEAGNQIRVLADREDGISLEKLAGISRYIEQHLDRDEQDFEITVSSPGVGTPLRVLAQYRQNIGRLLKVKTLAGEEIKGRIDSVDEQGTITLKWKERVPKPKGKGKVTVEQNRTIAQAEIENAQVQIEFK